VPGAESWLVTPTLGGLLDVERTGGDQVRAHGPRNISNLATNCMFISPAGLIGGVMVGNCAGSGAMRGSFACRTGLGLCRKA